MSGAPQRGHPAVRANRAIADLKSAGAGHPAVRLALFGLNIQRFRPKP